MASEYDHLRHGLLELARISSKSWEARDTHELFLEFAHSNLPLDRDALDKLLPEQADELVIPPEERKRSFLVLPPFDGKPELLGILALEWDFRPEPGDRGAFRLFLLSESEWREAGGSAGMAPIILRFDDREDNGDWGFAHAQLSDLFTPYQELFRGEPPWLPSELPRIPLAVKTSSSGAILVCILAALYGTGSRTFTQVGGLLKGDPSAKDVIRELSGGP